jgi:predicted metal-binding membrane protein
MNPALTPPVAARAVSPRPWVIAASATVWIVAACALWLTHGTGPHAVHASALAGHWAAATLTWQSMMVAMMLPVVLPWLRLAPVLSPEAGSPGRVVALFGAGYFAAWLLYSAAAALLQVGLLHWALLGDDGRLGRPLGAAVLVVAGAFQFTRLKEACLRHCRSPFGYLLASWRNGPPQPFRIGAAHGAYCVACCWALMTVAFAAGLTSVAWMAAIATAAALEQVVPRGTDVARLWGVLLLGAGVARLAGA